LLSRQQIAAERTYDQEDLNELKERLHDMKKKVEGILKRLNGFDKL
jgi:tetrahydromethanopterin S-methyltransferase subunit G